MNTGTTTRGDFNSERDNLVVPIDWTTPSWSQNSAN